MVDPVTAGATAAKELSKPVLKQLIEWAKTAYHCKTACSRLKDELERSSFQAFVGMLAQLSQRREDQWDVYQELGDLLDKAEYALLACQKVSNWDGVKLIQLGNRVNAVSAALSKFTDRHGDKETLTHLLPLLDAQQQDVTPARETPEFERPKEVFQHQEKLVPTLQSHLATHRIVAVVGMAGLGKTTIAGTTSTLCT